MMSHLKMDFEKLILTLTLRLIQMLTLMRLHLPMGLKMHSVIEKLRATVRLMDFDSERVKYLLKGFGMH
jgi:hypothetical protein